uniref:MAR-binding filament-like protein 1-1 n=1 Tax=Kalanchoe fedtschenkoi TaxID=63787 RepID=A0A7N0TT81_KALFE
MAGASGFLQSHSACSQHSLLLAHCTVTSSNKRSAVAVASLRQEDGDGVFRSRRAFLFVGVVAVLPLLQLPARAVVGLLAADEQGNTTPSEQEENEKVTQNDALSAPPILSFLNGFGIIGSGVLGALYALARQEHAASDAKIETLTKTLSDQETSFKLMQKTYQSKILGEQEEHSRPIKKAKDEQVALFTQLDAANITISRLGQELQFEKKALQETQARVDSLQSLLASIKEDKRGLEVQLKEEAALGEALQEKINSLYAQIMEKEEQGRSLASSFSEKDSELNELKAAYGRSTTELLKSSLEINKLEEEIRYAQKELGLKESVINDLSMQISALIVERDEFNERIHETQNQFDTLKSDSEKKAMSDAELVRERDLDLAKLQEKLEVALSDTKVLIPYLTTERDRLNEMIHIQINQVKSLKDKLESTQCNLHMSRKDALESEEMLKKTKQLCSELESEVASVQAELAETKRTFHRNLDEAKQNTTLLAMELDSVHELLNKTINELQVVSDELATNQNIEDDLQKELVDVQRIAEAAANELKEEKKVIASLEKELQSLEKQMSIDNEGRKSLEIDLEETAKSLDQVNRNRQLLIKDLELAESQISSLEDEKNAMYISLAEQKSISQATRENLEDAHNLVKRLGTDRENLDTKAKKLEDELAAAKGEILRLRNQTNSANKSFLSKTPSTANHPENGEPEVNTVTTSAKKMRRKKSSET